MKNFILSIIAVALASLLVQTTAFSQVEKPWKIRRGYINYSLGFGGGSVGANVHFNNRWGLFTSHDYGKKPTENIPVDYYEQGTRSYLSEKLSTDHLQDNFNSNVFGISRELNKRSDKAWVVAYAGVAFNKHEQQVFEKKPPVTNLYGDYGLGDLFTEYIISFFEMFGISNSNRSSRPSPQINYNSHFETSHRIGLKLAVQGNVTITRAIGLTGGVGINLNSIRIIPAANLGLSIGILHHTKK